MTVANIDLLRVYTAGFMTMLKPFPVMIPTMKLQYKHSYKHKDVRPKTVAVLL